MTSKFDVAAKVREVMIEKQKLGYSHPDNAIGRFTVYTEQDVWWLRGVVQEYTGIDPLIEERCDQASGHVALHIQVQDEAGKWRATAVSQPVVERNARGIHRYFETYGWPKAKPIDPREALALAERAFEDL